MVFTDTSNSPPPMLKWVRYRRVNFSSVTIYGEGGGGGGSAEEEGRRWEGEGRRWEGEGRRWEGEGREEVKEKGGETEGK